MKSYVCQSGFVSREVLFHVCKAVRLMEGSATCSRPTGRISVTRYFDSTRGSHTTSTGPGTALRRRRTCSGQACAGSRPRAPSRTAARQCRSARCDGQVPLINFLQEFGLFFFGIAAMVTAQSQNCTPLQCAAHLRYANTFSRLVDQDQGTLL